MKTLLLVDADITRTGWLGAGLEVHGFLLLGIVDSIESAINNITRCHPNIVLVAPKVAKITGASITRTIMESYPVPIVLLSDSINTSAQEDANWCGATAIFPTPPPPGAEGHRQALLALAKKLELMSEVPVIKRRAVDATHHPAGRRHITEQKNSRLSLVPTSDIKRNSDIPHLNVGIPNIIPTVPVPININNPPVLIGIASSTGGPVIVQQILSQLPANYPIPIVVIQHLTKGFSDTLVKWLDSSLALKVIEAHHGEVARPGYVYLVSGQMHAVLGPGLKIHLISRESYPGHCPSGTVFLNSMANMLGSQSLGIVLTGMGDDGSEGLLAIRQRGGLTYAQAESTCTMASMPHEAIAIGAVSYILPPEGIGSQLLRYSIKPKK